MVEDVTTGSRGLGSGLVIRIVELIPDFSFSQTRLNAMLTVLIFVIFWRLASLPVVLPCNWILGLSVVDGDSAVGNVRFEFLNRVVIVFGQFKNYW